jgi:protein O-GlcNAc transferase
LQSRKFQKELEVFVDIATQSFRAAAHTIQQYSPVVLVDVNGYMEGSQPELFALQLAPIQLSFQGVPLTTGAPYMNYRISDSFVAPPQLASSWTEHMVYMPHSYHVSQHSIDQDRGGSVIPMIERLPVSERAKYHLPSDVVLFGTFNNLVKVDPSTFAVWSNILRRVPASALWTAKFPPEAEPNLRAQAAAYGLHPQRRLIFTDRHAQEEHVKIKSLCDLYLDSPHHNAHATAVDVLWAGVPMLTQPMQTLPSRVATSLSRAAGMEDATTAFSVKQYEDLAVRLASDPDGELAAIRKTLEDGRASTPAFNMATFIRNYEAALFSMWDVYSAGEDILHHSVEDRSRRTDCSYNMCM